MRGLGYLAIVLLLVLSLAPAAAQRPAGAVFHLDVGHIGAVLKCLFDQWLGALAMAAPGRAKFEHGDAGKAVGLRAGGGLRKVPGGVGHGSGGSHLELGHCLGQVFSLVLQAGGGCRAFFDQCRVLLGHAVEVVDGIAHLGDAGAHAGQRWR